MLTKNQVEQRISESRILRCQGLGNLMFRACMEGDIEICKWIYQNENKYNINTTNMNLRTPFNVSCCKGYLDIVKWLYKIGADVEKKDKNLISPLLSAISEGHVEVVKFLYEINAFSSFNDKDISGNSAIYFLDNHDYIPIEKRVEIIKFLIKKKVIIDYKFNPKIDNILKEWYQEETIINNNNNNRKWEFLNCSLKNENIGKLDGLIKSNILKYIGLCNIEYNNIKNYINIDI